VAYNPSFGAAMRAGQAEFHARWVRHQQRKNHIRMFQFDGLPITVDGVLVQTHASNSNTTGTFLAHVDYLVDVEDATIVDVLKVVGDTWLPRIFEGNHVIRQAAAVVFRSEIMSNSAFSKGDVEKEISLLRGESYSTAIKRLLLTCLAGDLIDLKTKEWKPDAGDRFWQHVELCEILNTWVSLTPAGISPQTCRSGFTVLDCSEGYDKERDLITYEAQRMTGRDSYLPRQTNFPAFGLKQHAEHSWWSMEDMRYGYAYIWKTRTSPHAAIEFPEETRSSGTRISMDSRTLFLKVNIGLGGVE